MKTILATYQTCNPEIKAIIERRLKSDEFRLIRRKIEDRLRKEPDTFLKVSAYLGYGSPVKGDYKK